MSKREPDAYWIVPEYKRDTSKPAGAYWSRRVRYTIRGTTFPTWHKTGIIKDLETDLSLAQAQRKLKSWRAWKRKRDREHK